ncbi:hypothetical protein SCP_1602510 [Sparassis crispa]|uniref:Uncharacterized protein n=1 Tax=Sparassis crispa TaxID=139825 RepID=A0A401H570_9APHY|nr:hypothetical protein SCP_1602510 [Sparassis crispa]GBE89588.1 hypothetical protein SCP_1602510 [Sparassis crispa]
MLSDKFTSLLGLPFASRAVLKARDHVQIYHQSPPKYCRDSQENGVVFSRPQAVVTSTDDGLLDLQSPRLIWAGIYVTPQHRRTPLMEAVTVCRRASESVRLDSLRSDASRISTIHQGCSHCQEQKEVHCVGHALGICLA